MIRKEVSSLSWRRFRSGYNLLQACVIIETSKHLKMKRCCNVKATKIHSADLQKKVFTHTLSGFLACGPIIIRWPKSYNTVVMENMFSYKLLILPRIVKHSSHKGWRKIYDKRASVPAEYMLNGTDGYYVNIKWNESDQWNNRYYLRYYDDIWAASRQNLSSGFPRHNPGCTTTEDG